MDAGVCWGAQGPWRKCCEAWRKRVKVVKTAGLRPVSNDHTAVSNTAPSTAIKRLNANTPAASKSTSRSTRRTTRPKKSAMEYMGYIVHNAAWPRESRVYLPVIRTTAPEKVKKAAEVETRMMRAMRPLSAPKRSANKDTLLALGKAASKTSTINANLSI